jgi:hypothetical protein
VFRFDSILVCQIQSDLLADPHMLLPHQLMSLKNILIENETGVLDSLQNSKDDAHGMCSSPYHWRAVCSDRVGISNCNGTTSVDVIYRAVWFSTSHGNLSCENQDGPCIVGSWQLRLRLGG